MNPNLTDGEVQKVTTEVLENTEQQTVTAEDSSTENKLSVNEEQQPSQGGDSNPEESLPFHKHPRWKALTEENKVLKNSLDELQTFRQQVEPLISERAEKQKPTEPVPEYWQKLYGDTPEAFEAWKAHEDELLERATAKAVERVRREEEQARQQTEEYNTWMQNEFEAMKAEGLEFKVNDLNKFLTDFYNEYKFLPTIGDGTRIDFRKGLQMYNKFNPKVDTQAVKKQVASTLAPTKNVTEVKPESPRVGSLFKKRWNDT